MAKQKETVLVPVRRAVIVLGDKSYISEPENMPFLQNEAIEKILNDAGYDDILREYFDHNEGRELVRTSQTASTGPKTDAQKSDDAEKGMSIGLLLSKIHSKLVQTGSRSKLVTHLLVPDGKEYGPETIKEIETDVLPKLKKDQVEEVLSTFFTLGSLLQKAFPSYLLGNRTA